MSQIIQLFMIVLLVSSVLSAQSNVQKAIDQKDYKTVQKLNKELNLPFESEGIKLSPLSYASIKGDAEMVSLLIKNGAKVGLISEGYDALMYAAKGGNLECVQILINAGADVLNESVEGMTARDYAVQAGHSDVAVYLNEQLSASLEKRRAAARTKSSR